jgi:hypothetical protein
VKPDTTNQADELPGGIKLVDEPQTIDQLVKQVCRIIAEDSEILTDKWGRRNGNGTSIHTQLLWAACGQLSMQRTGSLSW